MREIRKHSAVPTVSELKGEGGVMSTLGPLAFIGLFVYLLYIYSDDTDDSEYETPKKKKKKRIDDEDREEREVKKEKSKPIKRKKRKTEYYREDSIPAHLRYEFDRKT